ncbi:PD-(D/E)XK motif protein [Mycolicibacillus parakoreensis]|uniref:PD-(D/E)XK motif protein n=1 Tax=Mycolicibacillus parakoreensis TaxID=1069221 RepID=A0ABY3U2Q2_9MYCO|nr:PD-(D/E)XK motif protein [Mycolicibacillus parakoreensis]MCV7316130.1 PD-(D/E)XK motif protein [Mycolicibacillus parakoreensis]ULN52255.1 PD-(D/E)XK motif protein [Mycolicibacillus parakoreensis]
MASRDLAAVWTVLESKPPRTGIDAVPVGYEVAAGELLAGVDGDGRRYLLIPLLPGEAARVDTRGRAVHVIRVQHAGTHYLAVLCLSAELHTIFTQFSRELVGSVCNADSPARAAGELFERWKALFSDTIQRGIISEERLIGLLGELLTIERFLNQGAPARLSYWRGPFGEAQDFRTLHIALEVKATLTRDGRIIGVSGIDQLQPPPNSRIYLVHYRFERDPGGFNIADVNARILALGASTNDLASGLAENGVFLDDLAPYLERRYRCIETRCYDVMQSHFPRITRDSFVGSNIPPGTLRFSYSIDLTNEPPLPLSPAEADLTLREMAVDATHGMDS